MSGPSCQEPAPTRLLRQMTGHMEQPRGQQQHRHPQNSHLTLTGRVFLRVTFTRVTVALNSSGATLAWRRFGKSTSNLLDRPNTVMLPAPLTTTGSGIRLMLGASSMLEFSSCSSYIASKSAIVASSSL